MSRIPNIAKNTSYLTLALVLQKIISFTYFTLLARNLDPAQLGKYYLAISFTTIFAIIIDLGLINLLTREVAKKQDKASFYLGNILSIKIPLSLLALGGVFLFSYILNYPLLTRQLIYIASICMILDSFTTTFYSISRGLHNLKFESIGSVVFQILVMTFGLTALYQGFSLKYIITALVIASIFNFTYSLWVINSKLRVKVKLLFDKVFIKKFFLLAIPFGAFAIFQRIYTHLDTVFLSVLAGETQVGLYQISFKIIFALQFLPLAFIASLYPAMSHYWHSNLEQLKISFQRAINYLLIISVPITFGVLVLAHKIVLIFREGYTEATLPLQIAIISLVFIFLNFPIGSLLNACDRQKRNTLNMFIALIASIVLNLILIPTYQAAGAAFTVMTTNLLMVVLGLYWVKKTVKYNFKANIIVFLKTIFSALIMSGVLFYLKDSINVFLLALLGAIIYFLTLFLVKGFDKGDIKSVFNSFLKTKNS